MLYVCIAVYVYKRVLRGGSVSHVIFSHVKSCHVISHHNTTHHSTPCPPSLTSSMGDKPPAMLPFLIPFNSFVFLPVRRSLSEEVERGYERGCYKMSEVYESVIVGV